jgi:hypothetical protein
LRDLGPVLRAALLPVAGDRIDLLVGDEHALPHGRGASISW